LRLAWSGDRDPVAWNALHHAGHANRAGPTAQPLAFRLYALRSSIHR
jgi:hypothetical protein